MVQQIMNGGVNLKQEVYIFVDRFVKEIRESSAAVFVGAGFSKSSGYVDWKNLLRNMSQELGLDVDKEYDLVSLAQYCYNKNGNRSIINDTIFEEFSQEKEIDENHRILARIPIFTYWTTNYDSLIEDALSKSQRIADVKHNNKQLSITKPHRDAVVYKMHGDKSNPDDAIIIKDDYEKYYHKHAQFITALSGDLISKTFLFIGFSFYDPNIDYILSRIRIDYEKENQRQHYALMRKIQEIDFTEKADYEYAKRKHELFIDDLKRYNIKVLMLDDYGEITEILHEIDRRLNYNNIFISGSAIEYGAFEEKEAIEFIHILSNTLIRENYNLISGFGLGVGSAVISGALHEIYMKRKTINDDRLILRPFPQEIENDETRQKLWTDYRKDMISRAGISIFLFGNKLDDKKQEVILANGVLSEYEIAFECGNFIIPVGCTGYVAQSIWTDIAKNLTTFYPKIDKDLEKVFNLLNVKSDSTKMVENIINFINLIRKK